MAKTVCIFDWDKTLSPHYMQHDLFVQYDVDEKEFWAEAHKRTQTNTLALGIECFLEHEYLNLMLDYVQRGLFHNLNNRMLTAIGESITKYPGVDALARRLTALNAEIFIVSSGIRSMLKNARPVDVPEDHIIASEFTDYDHYGDGFKAGSEIRHIARSICPTDKVRVLTQISEGVYGAPIPYANMIYVGDGVTDVPAFEFLHGKGGLTVGVYDKVRGFSDIEDLRSQGLLDFTGLADYRRSASVGYWIEEKIKQIGS